MRLSKIIFTLLVCLSASVVFAAQKQKQTPAKPQQKQTPTAPAKTSEAKSAEKPAVKADDQWALLIGISNYPGEIQKLTYPRQDALAIKELLLKSANYR